MGWITIAVVAWFIGAVATYIFLEFRDEKKEPFWPTGLSIHLAVGLGWWGLLILAAIWPLLLVSALPRSAHSPKKEPIQAPETTRGK